MTQLQAVSWKPPNRQQPCEEGKAHTNNPPSPHKFLLHLLQLPYERSKELQIRIRRSARVPFVDTTLGFGPCFLGSQHPDITDEIPGGGVDGFEPEFPGSGHAVEVPIGAPF